MKINPLKTFIMYSSKDRSLREELESHLRPLQDMGWIKLWSDRAILAGDRWDQAIKKQLAQADLFLMLVSVDFYDSAYIREKEFTAAVARLQRGAALVIPIIVRACAWEYFSIIKDLQVLPPSGIPVNDTTYWRDRDIAWKAVVKKIGERVELRLKERHRPSSDTRQGPQSAKTSDLATKAAEKSALMAAQRRADEAARPKNGQVRLDHPHGPEMVFIEGGTFQMGSHEEKPIHPVTLSSFWLGKYPVTFEEFDRFCVATQREQPSGQGWSRARRPAINVSWEDAVAYCAWLSFRTGKRYRLPTEAEWEYAARGGNLSKGCRYAGSNSADEAGWHKENSGANTHPVGRKKANELGLHDMSGNVWEWCGDWFAPYKKQAQENPKGPERGEYRVMRGGSWYDVSSLSRSTYRIKNHPANRISSCGFRVARQA